MPDPALLDPNNRLLGWSTSDLSLYGGQPTVTLGAPRAADAGGVFVSIPSALPDPNGPGNGAGAPLDLTAPAIVDAPSRGDDGATDMVTAPVSLAAAAGPIAPAAATPGVPGAVGAGSLAPIAAATPLAAQEARDDSPAALGGGSTAAAFAAPVLDVAAAAPAAPGGLATAALNPAFVAPVVAGAADLATTTVAAAGETLAAAGMLLDGLVAAVPADTVAATLAPAVAATATLADVAGGALGATVDTAVDALAGTSETVGALAAPVTDLTDVALGGDDPAGGVATLVGMVESADLFDLSSIAGEPAAITEGGSILDALAADEAPDALLGVDGDGGDGLLGGLDPHDDQGGLLGGL